MDLSSSSRVRRTLFDAPAFPTQRLAILPFNDEGLADKEKYLSEGLMSALISALSRDGLHVLAEASVIESQRERKTPEQLGRAYVEKKDYPAAIAALKKQPICLAASP